MVKELDEETFKQYLIEWGKWNVMPEKKRDEILEQFRKWELDKLDLKHFGPNFKLNEIEINGLNVKVWWYYVYKDGKYVLSDEIETLYPKNR